MKRYTSPSFLKGQAIIELGVLGVIIILLLGSLINYALRSNYQVRLMQLAFRRALASGADSITPGKPLSVSHIVIRDRHLPDPGNIFGKGSVTPLSASASVTRNFQTQKSPESDAELPLAVVSIGDGSGERNLSYKSAGFTYYQDVYVSKLDDYYAVFGQTNIASKKKDSDEWIPVSDEDNRDQYCIYPSGLEDDNSTYWYCQEYALTEIRVLDYCAGEFPSYYSCKSQCQDMSDKRITRPGYCSSLNKDFELVEPSYVQTQRQNQTLTITTTPTPSGVTDTTTGGWSVETKRTVGGEEVTTTVGE